MAIHPVSLAGVGGLPADAVSAARPAGSASAPFAGLVDRFLGGAVHSSDQAQAAMRDLALGRTDSLHEVMLQVAEADLSFRLILEMRNRLTDAYQEIMKMQV